MVWLILFQAWLDASKVSKFVSRAMVKKIGSYVEERETFLMEYIVRRVQGICRTFVLAVTHVKHKNIIKETAIVNNILNNVTRYAVTWTMSL
jgi:hypothetical protein